MTLHGATVTLKVNPESLFRTKMGTISGEIWLETDGWAFPATHWSDIVIPVLSAWLAAIHDVSRGLREREVVHFMDGPYFVGLTASGDSIDLLLTTGRSGGDIHRYQANAIALLKSATNAAAVLLGKCRELKWENDDIDELRRIRNRTHD